MLNTVNIVDTTFETTTKQLYVRTKRKMFQYSCRRMIYIKIPNRRYRYRLQLENAIEKSITKQAFCNYGDHTFTLCIVYKKFDFFSFFLRVCVNIRKNCLLCAVNRQSCIPFEQYSVFFFFFMCVWICDKIHKKKYRAMNRESSSTFDIFEDADIDKKKNEKKKREKEIKRRNKKKGKYLIRYFYFSPHACIYVQKGRATMISRHFYKLLDGMIFLRS